MSEKTYREGETVSVEIVSRDAEGKIMGEGGYVWYGMNNAEANMVVNDLFEVTNEQSKKWSAVKNGQVEVTQKPGVMR